MGLFWRALVAACLVGAVGCDGGRQTGTLAFEVAAPSGGGCSSAGAEPEPFGDAAPCTVLRLYRRDEGGGVTPVRIFRSDADHTDPTQGAFELRFSDRRITFDAMLEEDEAHDLFLTVYTGRPWGPSYGAHLSDVRVDQRSVRVRLYPFREWSCAARAGAEDGKTPAPRALHAAVTVGNGDVLLLGGVTGAGVDPAGAGREGRAGAQLQPIVEVYDPVDHRFRDLTMVGGSAGFARVLFGTIYLGEDGPNRYRVRAVGGFEVPEDNAGATVLEFDNSGVLTTLGAPFVPTEDARAAAVVDLVYDAEQLTLEIVPPAEDPLDSRGAQITVSTPLADGTRVLLMGFAGSSQGWVPSSDYFQVSASGGYEGQMLLHQRLGASIEPILGDRFLVWGGDVAEGPTSSSVLENAGEILVPGASTTALSAVAGALPRPTAFHTATSIGDDLVLIAGGVSIADTGNLLEMPAEDPIFALRAAGGAVTLRDVVDTGYTPTMLHTATQVPGWGVVLVGGVALRPATDRLTPVAQVGQVSGTSGVLAFDGSLQDLAQARFGHVTTLLPGNRLLVTGGFERTEEGLRALSLAEVLFLANPPYSEIPDGACVDQASLPDAGSDAGSDAGTDAGVMMMMDGGAPTDASMPVVDAAVMP